LAIGQQSEHLGGPFELRSSVLGALPIVAHFAERLGLVALLERWLPAADPRVKLAPARAIAVVVANLCVSRAPLYGLGDWAAAHEASVLGLGAGEVCHLNDDRIGRALDLLFECDRASLLCELVLAAVEQFRIDTDQLHSDSTSISVHGNYAAADGRERAGKRTVAITRGHSKDHRPDLKQLVVILTVSADGAVPLAQRVCDGNTSDATTHTETWEGLRALVGRPDFLYVADCKLATREQMGHIDASGGRFVSVLPRGRRETARLCEWMTSHTPAWSEAARRPGARRALSDDVWSVVPAPIQSAEGHRIVWVHSTRKAELDQAARNDQLARALQALDSLNTRLAGPKCQIHDRAAVEHQAASAVRSQAVTKLIDYEISEHLERWTRIESRGRGKKPGPRHYSRERFKLTWAVNEAALAHEAAAYGCFALITNDRALSDAQLLAAYRYQPNLEKRHHQLKSVLQAAPIHLKSPARIEALLTCQFIALLLCALIERELRNAMTATGTENLALYPEQRACPAPTAARILDTFTDITRHHLLQNEQLIQVFEPQLTPLQQHVLQLLGTPQHAYNAKT
jgi:transposase